MKIRTGFVSNSSSSSFIVTDQSKFDKITKLIREVGEDWYEMHGILYTSPISDGLDLYNDIYDLADDSISMGFGGPYDEENYYEFEGDNGVSSVWVQKYKCTDLQKVEENRKKLLYEHTLNAKDVYEIYSKEDIETMSIADIIEFIDEMFSIAGVYETEEDFYED